MAVGQLFVNVGELGRRWAEMEDGLLALAPHAVAQTANK